MTATIAYDRPVRNFIDQLSATGHVYHDKYRKTSVTFHHNAGRLSHDGIMQVWTYRKASAHFDVDVFGKVAQYVAANEYAWAVGNTFGNQHSISIEMCNTTLAPNWLVGDDTWKSAARLAAWLFWKVIGERPVIGKNMFRHHDWTGSGTACAGPFIDSIWSKLQNEVIKQYDLFVSGSQPRPPSVKPSPLLKTGSVGRDVEHLQSFLRKTYPSYINSVDYMRGVNLEVDGVFGRQTDAWVRKFQANVGLTADGVVGPKTYVELRRHGYTY